MRASFLVAALFCVITASAAFAQSGFEDYQIAQQDYLWKTVIYNQTNKTILKTTAPAFKPLPEEIKVYNVDLNADGRPDFLAVVTSFYYRQNGTYPVYVMIAGDYNSYTQLPVVLRAATFDAKALDETHNDYKDIMVSGIRYYFDGTNYVPYK